MKLEAIWYGRHWLAWPLVPLAGLYRLVVAARRSAFRRGWLASVRLPVPVILVGNLTVGGTGKTPLVLWLSDFLRRQGWHPGIVLRGYGGSARDWPRWVTAASDPRELGDEAGAPGPPLRRTGGGGAGSGGGGAAAVGRGRLRYHPGDDGLQHYRLQRDLEILVIDGARGFGNGFCLPAGPLREPVSRGRDMGSRSLPAGPGLVPSPWPCDRGTVNLRHPARTQALARFKRQRVTAVAGIGNPERFFALLRRAGLHLDERPYPDHHGFTAADAATWPPGPVIMTEKDAVKC